MIHLMSDLDQAQLDAQMAQSRDHQPVLMGLVLVAKSPFTL
jgi:hypothetical protein